MWAVVGDARAPRTAPQPDSDPARSKLPVRSPSTPSAVGLFQAPAAQPKHSQPVACLSVRPVCTTATPSRADPPKHSQSVACAVAPACLFPTPRLAVHDPTDILTGPGPHGSEPHVEADSLTARLAAIPCQRPDPIRSVFALIDAVGTVPGRRYEVVCGTAGQCRAQRHGPGSRHRNGIGRGMGGPPPPRTGADRLQSRAEWVSGHTSGVERPSRHVTPLTPLDRDVSDSWIPTINQSYQG